jgi:hypothetical protein
MKYNLLEIRRAVRAWYEKNSEGVAKKCYRDYKNAGGKMSYKQIIKRGIK